MIYSQACRLDNLSVNNGGNAYFFTIIHIIFSISNSQAAKIRQMMPNCRIFNSFLHSLAAICGRHHFRYDYYEKHFLIMVIIFLVPPKKQEPGKFPGSLSFLYPSTYFLYCPNRAYLHTVPAMQAMFLMDLHQFSRNVNAFLRAFGITQLTADAALCHPVSTFFFLCTAKGKRCTLDRVL